MSLQTKYDLSECNWKAYHSDGKIIQSPNYVDINRKKLIKFELINNGKVLFSHEEPEGKFKLFARLRSKGKAGRGKAFHILSRKWLIGVSKPLKFWVITEDGKVSERRQWNPFNYQIQFREDEL